MTYKNSFLEFVALLTNQIPEEFSCVDVGYTFIYKGDRCTIKELSKRGFRFERESDPKKECIMTYSFFLSIPHVRGKYKLRYTPQNSAKHPC